MSDSDSTFSLVGVAGVAVSIPYSSLPSSFNSSLGAAESVAEVFGLVVASPSAKAPSSRSVSCAYAGDNDVRIISEAATIETRMRLEIRAAIKPEGRSVQVRNAGRQLSEYILQQILPASARRSLFDKIEEAIPLVSADRIDNLRESPAANWMNGYFHLLRLLGNETSHHEESNRVPKAIEDKDLMVIMFAIERVLGFWIAWRTHQAASVASVTEPTMRA
jgi:hypothetical protein